MAAGPDGIMLLKTVGGIDVSTLGAKLAVREAEHGLDDGATAIIAIATENARGVFVLGTLAGASHRLAGVAWGGEDSPPMSARKPTAAPTDCIPIPTGSPAA